MKFHENSHRIPFIPIESHETPIVKGEIHH